MEVRWKMYFKKEEIDIYCYVKKRWLKSLMKRLFVKEWVMLRKINKLSDIDIF